MSEALVKISSLSRLVVIDGLRRNALIGLVLLAVLCQFFGLFFINFIPRDIGRAANDFIFSIGWVVGLLFLYFHAVNSVAWGESRRVFDVILARPLSRVEYVFGVFSGLALLLLLLDVILSVFGLITLTLIKRSVDVIYFADFSLLFYGLSWVSIFVSQLSILAVILFFSSIVRGTFVVLLLSLAHYLISNGIPVIRSAAEFTMSKFTLTLMAFLNVFFPSFSKYDYKGFVVYSSAQFSVTHAVTDLLLLISFSLVLIFLSGFLYSKRDLA